MKGWDDMANNDLKTMVKQALEKDAVFFEEAVTRLEDLRFYVSRFGINCDDQLVQQVDAYMSELISLKNRIGGTNTPGGFRGAGDGGGSGGERRNVINATNTTKPTTEVEKKAKPQKTLGESSD